MNANGVCGSIESDSNNSARKTSALGQSAVKVFMCDLKTPNAKVSDGRQPSLMLVFHPELRVCAAHSSPASWARTSARPLLLPVTSLKPSGATTFLPPLSTWNTISGMACHCGLAMHVAPDGAWKLLLVMGFYKHATPIGVYSQRRLVEQCIPGSAWQS